MRALITGGAGYIGRHLARALLAAGWQVTVLDRDRQRLAELAAGGVHTLAGDVTERQTLRKAVRDIEVVYHLAGSALGSRSDMLRSNRAGAAAIAAVCGRGSGVRALVYASSGALYPSGNGRLDEETEPAPAFSYAQAKYAAEQILLHAVHTNGVPAISARIAGVYGPGSPNLMLPLLRRGQFRLIGGGKGYISSIHVDDVTRALMATAEQGQAGKVYNLADAEPTTVRAFYYYLAGLLGAAPPPTLAPAIANVLVKGINWIARLQGKPAVLPPDLVAMAAVSHRMSNRRMHEELGVRLRYPSYREGLIECVGLKEPGNQGTREPGNV
jgi:nucleoside-diphosphate-sugar epimerase